MGASAFSESVSAAFAAWFVAAQLAAFLSLLLLVSAAHKMLRRERALRAARDLGGISRGAAAWIVAALAAAEASAGVLLWVPDARPAGAGLAALIWSLYCAALLRAVATGRSEVDCGCSFGEAHRALGAFQWMRALVLALLSAFVALAARNRGAGAASAEDLATQLLAGFGMLAVYGALDQLTALRPLRAGEAL